MAQSIPGKGPPEAIPASELWTAMLAVPRAHRVVDVPRLNPATDKPVGQVAMFILTEEESMVCIAAAERWAREQLKDGVPKAGEAETRGYADLYNHALSCELLYRSCKRVENLAWPAFPSPTLMRKHLTQDELGVLMNLYFTVQAELGPIVSDMSKDEMNAWLVKLAEGGQRYFLDLLSSESLKRLLMHSVSLLSTLPTDSGLPGSLPEKTISDAPPDSRLPYAPTEPPPEPLPAPEAF